LLGSSTSGSCWGWVPFDPWQDYELLQNKGVWVGSLVTSPSTTQAIDYSYFHNSS
jgi:hypothetical protein